MAKKSNRITILVLSGLLYSGHAHAYFDPGTGSIIIQSLVGIAAFLALSWHNIKLYIRSKLSKTSVDDQNSSDKESSPDDITENPDIKRCD